MNKYAYRRASRIGNVPADVVGQELTRIWAEHDQKLQPADVVDDARPEEARLHPAFEWNDAIAAEAHRLWQARMLIKAVRVVTDVGGRKLDSPAFVHVRLEQQPEPATTFYQSSDVLPQEPVQYLAALGEARRKLAQAMESFQEVRRLAEQQKSDGDQQKLVAVMEALSTAHALASGLQ